MLLKRHTIHPFLKDDIYSIWSIESDGNTSLPETNIVVPNGRMKLLLPCFGKMEAIINGQVIAIENDLFLVGLMDKALILHRNDQASMIGIDFYPPLAAMIFNIPLYNLSNKIYSLADIWGNTATDLQDALDDSPNIDSKIKTLQSFLSSKLKNAATNNLVHSSIQEITSKRGSVNISQLSKYLGYSKRYLDTLFFQHVGVSPKTYASIIRFEHIYKTMVLPEVKSYKHINIYDYYYDQSHFIKEFRRFAGVTPLTYLKMQNTFAEKFYR